MASEQDRNEYLSKAASAPPTPAFPKLPDEIKNWNPVLKPFWEEWEHRLQEWVVARQVSGG